MASLGEAETKMNKKKPILFVEDDRVDAMAARRAFKEINVPNEVIIVSTGEEALSFLKDENTQKPGVVVLDLNMPRMNGLEFLKIIKQDEVLKTIPVVVLTTSDEERDIIESFSWSVAGYMVKPAEYAKFVEVLRIITRYWTLSKLPSSNITPSEQYQMPTQ
ncbi:MAG: response regulator [Promethearchaeota archaeon]